MAKLPRVFQNIFGSNAPSGDTVGGIIQFGSFAAGSTNPTTNLTTIQSLAAFANGWLSAVIGQNGPTIEDMNALWFLITSQMAYQFQAGIPEWETNTIYYTGSLVMSAGTIYKSLQDANQGNALSNASYWATLGGSIATPSSTYSVAATDDIVLASPTSASFAVTLPAVSASYGRKITIKNKLTNGNSVTITAAGSDTIDGSATQVLSNDGGVQESLTLFASATEWNII
jgi:hypothetical protein